MLRVLILAAFCVGCDSPETPPATAIRPDGASGIQVRYEQSDGFHLVCSLDLTKDSTFDFNWISDTGPVARAKGTYSLSPGEIRFQPDSSDFRQDPRAFTQVMKRIKWGPREYLLGEERMMDFVNAINAGDEPRGHPMGVFYLREGDEAKEVTGFPELAMPWNNYLLARPVTGTIVSVEQRETPTQRPIIVLNSGRTSGLRVGMKLFSTNPDRPNFLAYLTLIEVAEKSAKASVTFQVNHVKKGDRFDTRRPEARPSN